MVENTRYVPETEMLADFYSTEKVLRFMAREPRIRRRMLADALLELIAKTPESIRGTRVILPSKDGDPHFVFLLLPYLEDVSENEYRVVRAKFLEACCLITRLRFPVAKDIVAIATESGYGNLRSEDVAYFDARNWNEELQTEALELQKELGILQEAEPHFETILEYPSEYNKPDFQQYAQSKYVMRGRDRNKPCICGSGIKFKKCCGKKLARR